VSLGLTTLCVGLWVPPSLAQTSPTTTFDTTTVDLFDQTEGRSFSPLDLIHQANLSREDPFSFFQRQSSNLNSEASDFRSRQLEQLRDQGYKPPGLATEAQTENTQEAPPTVDQIEPSPMPTSETSETILRINLSDDSSLAPTLSNDSTQNP